MSQSALLITLLLSVLFYAIPCTRLDLNQQQLRMGDNSVSLDSFAQISSDLESEAASSKSDILKYISGQKDKLKIKFYNSNEATKSKEFATEYQEFKQSFDPNVDVVVTCQSEATVSLHKKTGELLEGSNWHLMGHGSHWGKTSYEDTNAQILNVFVRLNGNFTITRDPQDFEKGTDWILNKSWKGHSETRMVAHWKGGANTLIETSRASISNPSDARNASKPPFLLAKSRLHETSGMGKGAVTTFLSLSSGTRTAEIAFICAHAASSPGEERERGMRQIWDEVRKDYPSADSIFLLGDLNYRLLEPQSSMTEDDPEGDAAAIAKLLLKSSDREKLKPLDQLSGGFAVLTKKEDESGLGMACNKPFKNYLPTYKRVHKQACSTLDSMRCDMPSSEINTCNGTEETCVKQFAEAEQFALDCYFVGKEDLKSGEFVAASGRPIGFKTVTVNSPGGFQMLMVWDVDTTSSAWEAKLRPGFWITKITESNLLNSSQWQAPIQVEGPDKSAKDINVASTAYAIDKIKHFLEAKEGQKMKVEFAWKKRTWKRKEKGKTGILQLGWLDRLCWKDMLGSNAVTDLKLDKAILNPEGSASDHVPTHFLVEWKKMKALGTYQTPYRGGRCSATKKPVTSDTLIERLKKSGGVEDHIAFAIWCNCQSLSTAPEPEECYDIVADHFQVTVEQLKAAVTDMNVDWQSAYEEAMDTLKNTPKYFDDNDWPTGEDHSEVSAM